MRQPINKVRFTQLLKSTASLNSDTLPPLRELAGQFPYCPSIHLLYARNLQITDSIDYDGYLKTAAIYCGNRNMLSAFLKEQPQTVPVQKGTAKVMPSISRLHVEDKGETVQTDREKASVKKGQSSGSRQKQQTSPDSKDKPRTFTEWLLTYKESSGDKKEEHKSPDELMDNFLEEAPGKITPKAAFYSPVNMARKSTEEHEEFVTETMARVHAGQGNISKAIAMYKTLSLKYPEKSSYFASLIKELEENEKD